MRHCTNASYHIYAHTYRLFICVRGGRGRHVMLYLLSVGGKCVIVPYMTASCHIYVSVICVTYMNELPGQCIKGLLLFHTPTR